eukprot:SM000065S20181  [mRNA]  locus=s65:186673:188550:- [translate_table: standard]
MVLPEVRPAGAAAPLEEPHVQEVPTSRTPLTPEEAANFQQRVVEFGKASTAPPRQLTRPLPPRSLQEKWMPLHTVAAAGQTVMVARLLRAGVDIDARDADGLTALHRAVFNGREAMVKQLVKSGADVAVLDEGGATLLHYAAQNGSTAAARVLCSCGVNVDRTDKREAARLQSGWTALHVAAQSGRVEMVRCLLLQGARTDIRNNDGATPLEVALSFGRGFGFHLVTGLLRKPVRGPSRQQQQQPPALSASWVLKRVLNFHSHGIQGRPPAGQRTVVRRDYFNG